MTVGLSSIKSRVLEGVRDYLDSEVYACKHEGIEPEQRPAFEALIRLVERELWRRPKYRREWKARQEPSADSGNASRKEP